MQIEFCDKFKFDKEEEERVYVGDSGLSQCKNRFGVHRFGDEVINLTCSWNGEQEENKHFHPVFGLVRY